MDHFSRVSQTVSQVTSRWQAAPPITVVHSSDELPVPPGVPVRGTFTPQGVFIVAQDHPICAVAPTTVHEVVGHFGLRKVYGSGWRSLMSGILGGIQAGDPTLRLAREQVDEIYVGADGECNLTQAQAADEVAAAFAAWTYNSMTGEYEIEHRAQKRAKAWAGHFAREVLLMDKPVDRDELEGAVLEADHQLRWGGPLFGLGWRLKRWYSAAMPFDPKAAPMSLDECQSLLKAANTHYWRDTGEAFGGLLALAFVPIALLAGLASLLWSALVILQWVFGR